ncbi:MAG: hypothetical protein PVH29_08580 [Candidatus Zixiibacteriota bacterium]|jgi:hypothetical protein
MKSNYALIIIIVLLAILACFQVALIAGMPWGAAAWGGGNEVLPLEYRIASASSIIIYVLMAWIAGKRVAKPESKGFRIAAWIIFAFFCLNVIMNVISPSGWEKIWAPVALVLAWAFFIVAKGPKAIKRDTPING